MRIAATNNNFILNSWIQSTKNGQTIIFVVLLRLALWVEYIVCCFHHRLYSKTINRLYMWRLNKSLNKKKTPFYFLLLRINEICEKIVAIQNLHVEHLRTAPNQLVHNLYCLWEQSLQGTCNLDDIPVTLFQDTCLLRSCYNVFYCDRSVHIPREYCFRHISVHRLNESQ